MNENTAPESKTTASQNYLKSLLLFTLVLTLTLAAGTLLYFSTISLAKYMLGINLFSFPLFGFVYLAGFVWLLVFLLKKISRRVKDTEQQLSKAQQAHYRPTRIGLALLAVVPFMGLVLYLTPLDLFGFEKQKLQNELLASLDAWSDLKIDNYDLDVFVITSANGCPPSPEVRLSVRQFELVQVLDLRTNQVIPVGDGQCSYANFTPHELFMLADGLVEKYDPATDYMKIEYHPGFGFITNLHLDHCQGRRPFNFDRTNCENTTVFSSRLRWDNTLAEVGGMAPAASATPTAP